MIIEIEYYKGDVFLSGKSCSMAELKKCFNVIEEIYDRAEDNFTELFCRKYGWTVTDKNDDPDVTYDRDIKKLYKTK